MGDYNVPTGQGVQYKQRVEPNNLTRRQNLINPALKTLLIVDDDPSILKYLARFLMEAGYTVETADNGLVALEKFNLNHPSLILLDIDMPEIDGYEFCRTVRRTAGEKNIPIIFISGLHEEDVKLKSFSHGGVDHISKPLKIKEVEARVKLHLSLQEKIDELELFNRSMLDREGKIIELKEEVNELCRECSREIRYPEIWKEDE